ncbi:NACHT, LRR and PYD domains-containing protein 14-like [Acropora muricata]|uniref:NACHT, LRR and PYD domains-containing protein 14-like n=1 Tax=Acropora muricata TaxID=159855 RepID=UPI0034E563EA
MKQFAGCQSQPTKRRQFKHFCQSQMRSKGARSNAKMDCTIIKEAISTKTLSKLANVLFICWIVVGAVLIGAFSQMEISEPRYDFRCDGIGDIDKDFLQRRCYDQYKKQNHKLGIPPYLFILFNVFLILIVTFIYSKCVNSTVNELERSPEGAEGEPSNRRRNLFIAYLCQLLVSITLEITFFASLMTHLFYPSNFPSHFSCSLFNRTQSTNFFTCFNDQASYKNIWIKVVAAANGILAFFAFLEIIWILSRARNGKKFMENLQFYADHLKSNSDEHRQAQPEEMPLVEPQPPAVNMPGNAEITLSPPEHPEPVQARNDFSSVIQTLKEDCLRRTEQLSDLKQPFRRPNHGEGPKHDLKIDEIYVNVAIHKGRALYDLKKDRREQLKKYPPNAEDCHFEKPEDIIDKDHANVLVVGRPGIGKTSLSTKMLRLWATDQAFHEDHHKKSHFNIVFLIKFRRFNDNAELSLHELLARAETVQRLDDSVLEFVQNEPTKVLLIFDGLDEYSRKEDINAQEDDQTYKNNVEVKMPLSVLYNKLAAGELLRGASILTTTRPKAAEYVEHVTFQRTVEILGFTSTNVEEYVERFSQDFTGAKEKIWQHIKSNANLFSLCYIPVNCFLICHCLLQIFLSGSSQQLPTKITDIYQMTVKMVFFKHNRENLSLQELEKLRKTHMYKPFENFPEEVQKLFYRLGEIALKGIKEGRLLFESSEVGGLEECGLLHKLPDIQSKRSLHDPPKSQFCFTHLTVQEFFAAKHLVDTVTDEGMEEFVSKFINDGTWQVVLQFVAGLLKSSLGSIFINLLPKSTEKREESHSSEPETLTFWPATEKDKNLAVQVCKCLYEINDEHQPVFKNKIEKIKFNAVELSNCSLAPIDVAAVLHFLENAQEVLSINLYKNQLGELGANEVKKFILNREPKLQQLNLHECNLTDNAAKDFAAALKHSNCKLESLHLSFNNFTDNAAKDFAAALKHSNCKLESLDLSANKFTDNAAKDFAAALKHSNCKLESLDLSFNNFTDNAANDFAAALKHSHCKLKLLDLRGNKFTDNAAKDFAAALKHSNCKLKSLYLRGNNFTDNAAKDFAAALMHSNCKLKSLDLRGNNFTDNAAKDFAAALMHSNCKLESLDLRGNNFTDNAAKDFAAALKHSNCKLKSLDLRGNKFTDNAAKDFAAALKHSNCKLKSLDLRGNKFTDNAAKDFAAALKHSNCKLKSLDLSENNFTDNAAKDFAAALEHSNCQLESLHLMGNKFTEEGRKYLTDAGKQSNCDVFI